jgi:hypothetical protein
MTRRTLNTRRDILLSSLAGASALSLLPVASAKAADAAKKSGIAIPTGDIHDFDFFVGNWNSVNRRLKKRWVGSNEWETFPATIKCESRMGGVVNLDEGVFPTKGWSGMTVRVFNLEKRQWSLYWINSQTGELFPPVVGGFTGDHGVFYGDDTDEGRPIKVVFHWERVSPDFARWHQEFSLDGKNWEKNWIIEHTRAKS